MLRLWSVLLLLSMHVVCLAQGTDKSTLLLVGKKTLVVRKMVQKPVGNDRFYTFQAKDLMVEDEDQKVTRFNWSDISAQGIRKLRIIRGQRITDYIYDEAKSTDTRMRFIIDRGLKQRDPWDEVMVLEIVR